MKPCRKYRKQIAWLAMDSLEARHVPELRAHIDECSGCQNYFIETRGIAAKLHGAELVPSGEPSASFHRRVVDSVAKSERHSAFELFFTRYWSQWNLRLALPGAALVALAIVALAVVSQHAGIRTSSPAVNAAVATPESETELAPTVSNYEILAHQSLDKLDEVLTEQASKNSPSFPSCTAGQFSRIINTE